MIKRFAQDRMNHATSEIKVLLQRHDILSPGEDARLQRLDRSYKFWKQFG